MKTTTEILLPNDATLVVKAYYHEFSRGMRDSLGVPEEPDEDAYFEIYSATIDDTEYDNEELAIILNMTEDEVQDMMQEKLQDQYESDYDAYIDNQIDNYYDKMHNY